MVEGQVSLYVCGITAYDYSHMGHGRAYVSFDLFHRFLKPLNYQVKYVRNFTDVDDKIIKRADERECDPLELSAEFCQEFLTDMADLQCLPPTVQPRVSDHMDQIKNMIAKIIKNGCAYVVEGDVYFSVKSSPSYGSFNSLWSQDVRGDSEQRHKTFLRSFIDRAFLLQRGNVATVEQEVAATVESMEKAARYTSNKYVEAALNSTTVVLPYLVPYLRLLFLRLVCHDVEALHFKVIALYVVFCLSIFGPCSMSNTQNNPAGYDEYGDLTSDSEHVLVGDSRILVPPQNSVPIPSLENICRRSDLFCFPSTLYGSEANYSGFSGIKSDETVAVGSVQPMGNLSWSTNHGNFQLSNGDIVSCSIEIKESTRHTSSDDNDTPFCRGSSFDKKEELIRIKTSNVNDFSSLNVQISHPLLDWGQKYLHFSSLAYLTVENRDNHNVLRVFGPYSTNSQFYPCNYSEITVQPGETASICFVFFPKWLGLSSAHIILQTSSGGFLIQARGFGIQSPYAIHSSVGLNRSSSGKWTKVVSVYNPSDEALSLKEASVWLSFSSGNALYSIKGVCNVLDQKGDYEFNGNEWLDVRIGQVGQPLMAIRPHKTWTVGSNQNEPILELEFPHHSQANVYGFSCIQLLNSARENMDTDTVILEAEFGKRLDLLISLDVLVPCDANGHMSVSLLVENNGFDVLKVVKISEVGEKAVFLQTKYVEGLILFPHTVTQVATITYAPDQHMNLNCKLLVQTNISNTPELEVFCSDIASLCSRSYSYAGYEMFSYDNAETRSSSVHVQPQLEIKATEMAKADDLVLGNWRSQGTNNGMSVLDEQEVTFPMVHISTHQSKWISVVNPSDQPVVMQLLLNSGELINECRGSDENLQLPSSYPMVVNGHMTPSRYGFSIAGNALTEAYVHPREKAVLGPIVFHPSSRCEWKSSVLVRNNLSGVEWLLLRGSGGSISLRLLDGSDPVHTVQLKHNYLKPYTKDLFAKNTGDLPVEINRISISGTKCELDGFVVGSCKGFGLEPGESRKLTISYTADTCVETLRRELELNMAGGILVVPMEVNLSASTLKLCKRSLLWIIFKNFVLTVLIISMACSCTFSFIIRGGDLSKTSSVHDEHSSDVCSKPKSASEVLPSSLSSAPPSSLKLKATVAEASKPENLMVKTGNTDVCSKPKSVSKLLPPSSPSTPPSSLKSKASVIEASKPENLAVKTRNADVCAKPDSVRELLPPSSSSPPPSSLESKATTVEASKPENLTVKTGKEKPRRRRKRRGSGSGLAAHMEVSSSHSSNSPTPSLPSSPASSLTPKRFSELSPKQNVQARNPFNHGTTSAAPPAVEKPSTPPKTPAPITRAPEAESITVEHEESSGYDPRFEYNIWGGHLQLSSPGSTEVGSVTPNNSGSFFLNNPQELFTSCQAETVSSKQVG
ncbi:putative transmembrane protein [Tanacetum coccineum]